MFPRFRILMEVIRSHGCRSPCGTESITIHVSFQKIILMELLFASSRLRHDHFTFRVVFFSDGPFVDVRLKTRTDTLTREIAAMAVGKYV